MNRIRTRLPASCGTLHRGLPAVLGDAGTCSRTPRRARRRASTDARRRTPIGYSNGGGVGNGFREEQVCTAKAEATALGPTKVTPLTNLIHRNTDAAGQLADLRTLISQNVNALVFNPNDPDALNPALAEAHAAGIVTVSVDAYVTDPNTWNLYNNQVKYAYLGAKWLFDQLGSKGTVWYTRGLAGNPADSDRDIGFNQALKENPGHHRRQPGRHVHGLGSGDGDPDHERLPRQRRL